MREKRTWLDDHSFNVGMGVFALITIGAFGYLCISYVNSEIEQNKIVDEVESLDKKFNNTVSTVANLKEFKGVSATVEFDKNKDSYFVNIFGSSEKEIDNYAIVREFSNVKFEISEENAKSLIEAIQKRDEFNGFIINVNSDFGNVTDATFNKNDAYSSKSINKSYELTKEVYDALQNAVIYAYNHNVEKIGAASDMLNRISAAYRYVKPEILTEVEGVVPFGHISSEIVNCGLMVSGISKVYNDVENQTSFFYIDTIQTTDGKSYEHHKALVRIDGVLTAEEAYGKFLNGEIRSFAEVTKTQTQEDTALFMN